MEPEEPDAAAFDQTLVLSGFESGAFFMDRYRIERLLGAGAMGKVFRAIDTVEDRPIALKVLHPDMARKVQVLERFRREAQILRELGHHGIVRVFDSGQAPGGMDYLIMELLEGRTLKQKLRADGPMSPEELLPLLVQVCDALGAAHVQGVVHRDLKPDNIFLLTGDRVAKILDFGLSRLATQKRMTKTGMMLGTPRYMPPEQIRSAKDADARTDQYALAVVCHEALAGASPFPAADPAQLLGCVMEGRILTLEDQVADIGEELGAVVRRAMSRERKERYATIGGFVEAFAQTIGRHTGRSRLIEGSDQLDALFGDADPPDASGEVDLPDQIVAPHEPPRFTLPPGVPAQARTRAPAKKNRSLGWVFFIVLLLVVTCLSASIALGIRGWFGRADDGIDDPPLERQEAVADAHRR